MSEDRRAALKARHRRAILDAAHALISEGTAARFSVDQLAERADVSRRTIFNHFTSIDDVVTTACTEMLGVVIEHFRSTVAARPPADGGDARSALFADVAEGLREIDVPGTIAFLWQALGGFDAGDRRPKQIFEASFARTTSDLARELAGRHPAVDPLEVELLVSSMMHGVEVIAFHWLAATGAATGEAARAVWRDLLDRLITNIKTGY